ncbi:tRNA (N(6)-L-threonylcarbamoyladenosine(37)-C(2))-methylthiotransferase MtaB [Mesorhizobium sp. BR1-1-16]|uniref:tRNA (N(6)-L-threonylcarbamoyladenosine(37)-C(2))- methylthiotransferase MtaB n=1 Tax=Mesorhizobium sp. BR1-1-16 TaxID=2876653 RepID=UPI001CC979F1|nr:tRNA (N(6)-L-threonylcarbamoyladenosine(37)-C(2))-methylthiotransferase MtaB [Mesorhizobium sp. BR1-1-16]MBZ9937995.1 tRNA (N(6)-L-threonylcarbamoyladenosine(37)-C(2))-methylthiotransferase MtaB [Mesorhizobium sp. BR1-1-16]
MSLDVLSFGCRLNTLESEVMRANARAAGLDQAVLVNTCAVTAEAVRQARQQIRRARRERPGVPIIVSGCAAQIDPAAFAAMPEVDMILGNAEKLRPSDWRQNGHRIRVGDVMDERETAGHVIGDIEGHTRAFVAIQNGCDHRCTFCVIPYGRGPSRSVPMGAVVESIRDLVASGHAEVVLTGVDITAYGADLPGKPTLGRLVAAILKLVPELPRLRLSSLDTIEVDEALMAVIGREPRLMPHFHLSLQAGDDMILKRMKRRHGRDDAIRFCDRVRALRPDAVFGADLIAGFPTETESMFAQTAALVEECGLTHLHVFPFSPRPGTPAARMPQLSGETIKARAATLRAIGRRRVDAFLESEIGARRSVLAERGGRGRTEHFTEVAIAGVAPGRVVDARITGRGPSGLIATPIERAAST